MHSQPNNTKDMDKQSTPLHRHLFHVHTLLLSNVKVKSFLDTVGEENALSVTELLKQGCLVIGFIYDIIHIAHYI